MTDQASAGTPARKTRRQLLAAGTGALAAALAAGAIARPATAAAANGDNVILGSDANTATTVTDITDSTDGSTALEADGTGSGIGVAGTSVSGDGVFGFASGDGNGVYGHADNAAASGVYGQNDGAGYGVAGRAPGGTGILGDSANGVGVQASSQNGTALQVTGTAHFTGTAQFTGAVQVTGTAQFKRSGVLIVAAGRSSATQTGVALTSASLVLVTLQQDQVGVWVRSAVPSAHASSFTVHLSKAVTANTRVAWFVVN